MTFAGPAFATSEVTSGGGVRSTIGGGGGGGDPFGYTMTAAWALAAFPDPSRAVKVITLGSIQLKARHSAVGVTVTCLAAAPGRFGITNTSGGFVLYE